jgi:hypothetical protein
MDSLDGKAGFAGLAGFADVKAVVEEYVQTVTGGMFSPQARSNMQKHLLKHPVIQRMMVS